MRRVENLLATTLDRTLRSPLAPFVGSPVHDRECQSRCASCDDDELNWLSCRLHLRCRNRQWSLKELRHEAPELHAQQFDTLPLHGNETLYRRLGDQVVTEEDAIAGGRTLEVWAACPVNVRIGSD